MFARQHQLINKALRGVATKPNMFAAARRANFSEVATQASESASLDTQAAEVIAARETAAPVMSLWEYSNKEIKLREEGEEADAQYKADLQRYQSEPGAFTPFEINGDSGVLRDLQKRINQVVEQEIGLVEFKDQIGKEELSAEVYQEVITKQNFFFKVDEHKKSKNLRVVDVKAPGNIHRKPRCILAHEHVNVSNYVDIDGQNKEQMMEIYGHYAYMIDMHIAQIRPENLEQKSYIPRKFNQVNHNERTERHLDNKYFEFYHRWREPTRTWFSQTREINFKKALEARPTTDKYDHDKGSKYDVEWTDD